MRKMKKMMTLLIAVMILFGMTASVYAQESQPDYSVTITNAKPGETYTAYKMFDLSVNDPVNPTAFRYTVNEEWADFSQTEAFKTIFTVDDQGYISSRQTDQLDWNGNSNFSVLADQAAQYAKNKNLSPEASVTVADGETTGILELSEAGYYVITSTLGSRAMIESTPSNAAVTIHEKNEEDSINKKVKEDSNGEYVENNDAQIGDTVEFKSEAMITARSVNVKIHDTMDTGLTLNAGSIKIYTDDALENEYNDAEIFTGANADEGDTFTIVIPDTFSADAAASQKLYIVYTAVLNGGAVAETGDNAEIAIQDQKNSTSIQSGAGTASLPSTTTTTTHKIDVFKHATGSNEHLADAIFQLKKGEVVVKLIKLDDYNYRVADATEVAGNVLLTHVGEDNNVIPVAANSLVENFVTVAQGNIVIWGVDADNDYSLNEVQAPKGYNLLSAPAGAAVSEDNSTVIDVANATGSELPSTGGIGTTIFYVIGAILVLAAGVLLVARRRTRDE